MLQVCGRQGFEQRRQRAPHMAKVLQKLSVKRFSATSCNRLGTPGEATKHGITKLDALTRAASGAAWIPESA